MENLEIIFDFVTVVISAATLIITVMLTSRALELTNAANKALESSLHETRKQFELSNYPFLQIELESNQEPTIDGLPISIKYRIRNLGKYPVKVLNGKLIVSAAGENVNMENFIQGQRDVLGFFIYDLTPVLNFNTQIDNENVMAARPIKKHMFFEGFYIYKNLLNDELNIYIFSIQFEGAKTYWSKNENRKLQDINYLKHWVKDPENHVSL